MPIETTATTPKIEFPCDDYPIKIIGKNHPQMVNAVINIFMEHVPHFAGLDAFTFKPSGKGNFHAMNTRITAESEQQLQLLNADLQQCDGVKIIL